MEGNKIGKEIEKILKVGDLVSDEIVLSVINEVLNEPNTQKNGWVLDGFPRTIDQSIALDELLTKIKQPLDVVFYLEVDESILLSRIKDRMVHLPSGRVYNKSFNPPLVDGKDDITGEPLTQREDDNIEAVSERLKEYKKKTIPILDYYKKTHRLVTINAPNSDIGYIPIMEYLKKLQEQKN